MLKSNATFYGFNPPFIGGPQNILSRQEDEKLIKNDIIQLLNTVPGERVMRPAFGVNLRNFVFEQSTPADLSILQTEIIQKIEEFEPRVIVSNVILESDIDRNGLSIKIFLLLKRDPRKEILLEQFISGRV